MAFGDCRCVGLVGTCLSRAVMATEVYWLGREGALSP